MREDRDLFIEKLKQRYQFIDFNAKVWRNRVRYLSKIKKVFKQNLLVNEINGISRERAKVELDCLYLLFACFTGKYDNVRKYIHMTMAVKEKHVPYFRDGPGPVDRPYSTGVYREIKEKEVYMKYLTKFECVTDIVEFAIYFDLIKVGAPAIKE